MNIATVVIQIIALGFFLCVAANLFQAPAPPPRYIRFIAGGLFLWLLSLMIAGIELHAAR
jgi:hypothetical protein